MPSLNQYTGFGIDLPDEAEFLIFGKHAGRTQIVFTAPVSRLETETLDGPIGTNMVDSTVTVVVRNCKATVHSLSEWHVPGEANIMIVATIDGAVMLADDQGHFTGSGTVNWTGSAGQVGDCSGAIEIGSSQVDLTGDTDDSGQIALQMNYQPAVAILTDDCNGAGGSIQQTLTPDALAFSMPDSGGAITQTQGVSPEGTGIATIILTLEEDEAAAAGAGSQTAIAESFSIRQALLSYPFGWLGGL
jgi:hypothetical protein